MKFINSIYNLLADVGRILAATHHARIGDHLNAQRIMITDFGGRV